MLDLNAHKKGKQIYIAETSNPEDCRKRMERDQLTALVSAAIHSVGCCMHRALEKVIFLCHMVFRGLSVQMFDLLTVSFGLPLSSANTTLTRLPYLYVGSISEVNI